MPTATAIQNNALIAQIKAILPNDILLIPFPIKAVFKKNDIIPEIITVFIHVCLLHLFDKILIFTKYIIYRHMMYKSK